MCKKSFLGILIKYLKMITDKNNSIFLKRIIFARHFVTLAKARRFSSTKSIGHNFYNYEN